MLTEASDAPLCEGQNKDEDSLGLIPPGFPPRRKCLTLALPPVTYPLYKSTCCEMGMGPEHCKTVQSTVSCASPRARVRRREKTFTEFEDEEGPSLETCELAASS